MKKKTLRQKMLQYLTDLTDETRNRMQRNIYSFLFQSKEWKQAEVVGVTYAKFPEWDTEPIMKRAWEENKRVAIPKTYTDEKKLVFFEINEKSVFIEGYGGILEPDDRLEKKLDKNEIDLLIVPGFAFDIRGYRIGHGGGYFDRFLADFYYWTISLCSERQIVEMIPNEPFDIPVQMLVTEKGCFRTERIKPVKK